MTTTTTRTFAEWRAEADRLLAAAKADGLDALAAVPLPDGVEIVPVTLEPEDVEHLDEDDGAEWGNYEPTDLTQYLDGTLTPPTPSVVPIPGGHLLYKRAMHLLFGESGGGKTWIALAAAAAVLEQGGRVLYIDHENGASAVVARLLAMGAPRPHVADRLTYITPGGPLDLPSMKAIVGLGRHDLAVVDSTGEHLAADGVNPDKDAEVAKAFNVLRRILCFTLGAAVILIDHVPKSTDADRHQAIGSQRKRAAADAAFRVDTVTPAAKGITGRFKLTGAKDRHGTWPKGATVVEMILTSNEDGSRTTARFEAPRARVERGAALKEAVSLALEHGPPEGLGVTKLRTEVRRSLGTAANHDVDHAAAELVRDGYLEVVDQGHGRPKLHLLKRPYRLNGAPPILTGTPEHQGLLV